MALPNAYLVTTKNLETFLNALQTAQAPERFTNAFLKQLDFSSSNDRLFVGVLKALGFIEENGAPTSRYFAFLDQGQSGRVLAEAIREAYSDLFAVNKNAQDLTVDEIRNKLRTLTLGKKSDRVISLMANTFKALTELADWEILAPPEPIGVGKEEAPPESSTAPVFPAPPERLSTDMQLHYNIQIHLPESRDPAVFDAIFQALRKHLP